MNTTDPFGRPQFSTDSTLLRRQAVESLTGFRRATIYQRIKNGLPPRPVKMGLRVSGWSAHEIVHVNKAIITGQSDDQIKALVADLVAARTTRAGQ